MAFIFAHPITGFTNPTDANKAGFVEVGTAVLFTAGAGRFGDGAFRITDASGTHALMKGHTPTVGRGVYQFAMKPLAWTIASSILFIYQNAGASSILELRSTIGGAIAVHDANGTLVGNTGAGSIVENRTHVIVIDADFGNPVGACDIYIDDMVTPKFSTGAMDLDDGLGTGADTIRFETTSTSSAYEMSQLFIYDKSGAGPWSSLIGDMRMYPLLPTSDDSAAWTPLGGAPNFDEVDDPLSAVSDEDTSYVEATSAAVLDQYNLADLPVGVTDVISVIANVEAKKTDAGAEHGALTVRLDHTASTVDLALAALTTDYVEYQAALDDVPGGAGWTPAQVNALKAGPRIA